MQKSAREILGFTPGIGEVNVAPGETVVVTGPNGVGKSAFIQSITPTGPYERFFGSRQIYFQSDETTEIGQALSTLLATIPHNSNRFRNPYGEQHLKSVIRRIIDSQHTATSKIVSMQNEGVSFADAKLQNPLPIDQINSVFEAARLAVRLESNGASLRALRGGSRFGIERLSDGERAALLLVGAVIIQSTGASLLVDEPERHLNPSISGPLIAAAVRLRSDIGFVFATHDLSLIDWLRPDKIIHISDSSLVSEHSDDRIYSYAILGSGDGIPEELRYAILGSRRALLLVEGTATSEDKALYGHVYPEWNIVGREGWGAVSAGVSSLSENNSYHWLEVAGLVDGDGRDESERNVLAAKRVFALSLPTIENVFALKDVVAEMAGADFERSGGEPVEDRLRVTEAKIKAGLLSGRHEIVSRRVLWAANRELEGRKVSFNDVRNGAEIIPAVDLAELRRTLDAEFEEAINAASAFEALRILPIKNSPIPALIATGIGYDNAKKYYRAVLHQIESGSDRGKRILDVVKSNLPNLPTLPPLN